MIILNQWWTKKLGLITKISSYTSYPKNATALPALQTLMESFIPHLKSYYQKELVESPPAGVGEIKIRLFITPILGLKGRGRSPSVNYQLSTVEGSLSWLKNPISRFFVGKFCKYRSS